MNRRALTLIELLIVITIIAILAGAAVPFVQQYVEESRYSRAKQDLNEIRNGLMRYEADQNKVYDKTDIRDLVGSYLSKALSDPWGSPYKIAPASSTCYTAGPDGIDNSGDEYKVYFRPPLALSKAYWEDSNQTGAVDDQDKLILKFSRPIRQSPGDGPQIVIANDDFVYTAGNPGGDYVLDVPANDYNMTAKLTLDFAGNPPFKPGQDYIKVKAGNTIVDGDNIPCIADQEILIRAR